MKRYLCTIFVATFVTGVFSQCTFYNHVHGDKVAGHERLKRIEETLKRTTVTDDSEDGFDYNIGVCKSADLNPEPSFKLAGVTQRKSKWKTGDKPVIIGSLTSADLLVGTDWLILEYDNGDPYKSHCGMENRTALIMFTCARGVMEAQTRVVEENKNKSRNCHYLFEIKLDAACLLIVPEVKKLSTGSILVIIFFVFVGVYLILGALYQRVVVGATGLEQIPNYAFWKDFGNLQADGCNFLCRSSGKTPGSREYLGIGDDQIQPPLDVDMSHDDNLLPM